MTTPLPPTPSFDDHPAGDQPPVATPKPELRRSATDRMIGGVSGGLAEYSGIDALIWRVGFIALALAGGSGFVIYLLLWVLMPSEPPAPGRQPSPLDGLIDRLHVALRGALSRRS